MRIEQKFNMKSGYDGFEIQGILIELKEGFVNPIDLTKSRRETT